jgi:hypothetical protein
MKRLARSRTTGSPPYHPAMSPSAAEATKRHVPPLQQQLVSSVIAKAIDYMLLPWNWLTKIDLKDAAA